jgi:hypothetical protein
LGYILKILLEVLKKLPKVGYRWKVVSLRFSACFASLLRDYELDFRPKMQQQWTLGDFPSHPSKLEKKHKYATILHSIHYKLVAYTYEKSWLNKTGK